MKISGISNKDRHNHTNKYLCPFNCHTCKILGDLTKSRYEIICILAENDKSVFWPMYERGVD